MLSATNPHVWKFWLYQASYKADYTNGYRFFKGQEISTVIAANGGTGAEVISVWGNVITLTGSIALMTTTGALVTGTLFSLF